ncbi:MAG: hypothetical protein HQ567_04155 [Candidatus Nealsonbacteria bacterium]|nr:hypothetical protein [Candidatus Nealsonbacteria bacterium]
MNGRRSLLGRFVAMVAILGTAGVAASEPADKRGPVAHWTLDETSGNRAADEAGDSPGTLQGSPTASHTVGLIGRGALEFTAAGQQITGPDRGLPAGKSPGSICLWFNTSSGTGDKVLFCYGSGKFGQARGLWLRDTRRLCFYFMGHPDDLYGEVPGGITPDRWHYVVATYNGTTARLYYDGRPIAKGDAAIDTVLAGQFRIGKNAVRDTRDFIGRLDDVAVYDRPLGDEEIRVQYEAQAEPIKQLATEAQAAKVARLRQLGVDEIIFAVRQPGKDGHWYANFGYWVTDPNRKLYGDGGRLCRLDLRSGKLTVLLDDPKGGVRDPQVHYDAEKILFSYRKGGQPHYHLYEIAIDGTGLRQLTDGPFDDFEPTYLPGGEIVFCSSRCQRWVPCWSTQVATLYRCDGDGGNLRQLSSNIEQENTPAVLGDGRLLYTRWEYVDRSQVDYHHLWTINPDGTGQMIYYGNQQRGTVMIDALPIPGTNRVVASFSPGHGRTEHAGAIAVVDPGGGPDRQASARQISRGCDFRDPYPLSKDRFLVARGASILAMDDRGATVPIYTLPTSDTAAGLQVHEPRPLRPRRRERAVPPRIDPDRQTGRLVLANVNHGRNMPGVKRGEIKRLLVLESLPEPVNFNGAYPYKASWMEPVTFGGTFALARVLGTVPVEADGSAHFELPAMRSCFFVALDDQGLSVKRMQSFVTVQPGETTSCAGCHEQRTLSPPVTTAPLPSEALMAMQRSPDRIEPFVGMADVPDFPRDVQPILDKHCAGCHNPDRRDGDVDLCGDRTPCYSHGYWTIVKRRLISDGRNLAGNRPPRTIGSSASRLVALLGGTHHDVKLSPQERTQIILWIETGAVYAGTYAAYHSGMVDVKFPTAQMTERCGTCHGVKRGGHRKLAWEGYDTRPWTRLPLEFGDEGPAESLCNLTRPEKSPLLLAPLAKAAGGYGICRPKQSKDAGVDAGVAGAKRSGAPEKQQSGASQAQPPATPEPPATPVFADTTDPAYQKLLAAITEARKQLDEVKRFDMPGYRPNEHYVREMKRYGILPPEHDPKTPLDPYATDQAYWRSMWYRPSER